MARNSFRTKVAANSSQQRTKTAGYGHLNLPKGIPIFKEELDSRVSLDILPYVVTDPRHPDKVEDIEIAIKGSLWYRRSYKRHGNVGASNATVVCPTSVGMPCPICEYRTRMLNDGHNWQDEEVRALRPSARNLYYVQPKNDKKLDDVPHIWDVAQFIFQDKLNAELAEKEDYAGFPDLEDGLTLRIRFSEQSMGKIKFAETSRIDFEARDYRYDERDIEALPTLDDVLIVKSYKDLEFLFFEVSEAKEESDTSSSRSGEKEVHSERERTRTASNTSARMPRDEETSFDRKRESPKEEEKPVHTGFTRGTVKADPLKEEEKPAVRTGFTRGTVKADPPKEEASAKDERDEKEARRAAHAATQESKRNPAQLDCPSGYEFGTDCDKYKECSDCGKWTACMDKLEAMTA